MVKQHLTILLLLTGYIAFAQKDQNSNYLPWSSNRKLTLNDFVIKTSNLQTGTSFAQFYMDFQVKGFDFMAKNFNKKVHNYFIKSASWIDTTYAISSSIKYQQTLFDMFEIYTRRFRKDLKENKKKVLRGLDFAKELNAKAATDFSNRRVAYDTDTKFGTEVMKQQEWEEQIRKELDELKDFAIEDD